MQEVKNADAILVKTEEGSCAAVWGSYPVEAFRVYTSSLSAEVNTVKHMFLTLQAELYAQGSRKRLDVVEPLTWQPVST